MSRPEITSADPAIPPSLTPVPEEARCPNCETPVFGRYCVECGQRNGELRPTMALLLKDVTRYVFRIDGKFLTTLRRLFVPGFLTREYLEGRRERYERPFRFFVVINVAFFLLAGAARSTTFDERASSGIVEGMRASVAQRAATNEQRIAQGLAPLPETGPIRFVRRIAELPVAEFQLKLRATYLAWGPRIMFLIIPITALVLALVYRRRDIRFAEHFVFCLHYQAFGTVVTLPGQLLGWSPLLVAAQLLDLTYLYLSMRRVYGDGRLGTLVRMVIVYGFAAVAMMTLSMGIIGAALAASL